MTAKKKTTYATMNRIRQAAIDNGWTIKARVGETIYVGRADRWKRDIFEIGRVERQLPDGTSVVEPEHSISVWYRRDGAVRHASAHSFTALGVVGRRGISTIRTEKRKADRIIAALTAGTGEIPL